MILTATPQNSVEYVGDIQENTVGIDKDNIGFITDLLTRNLYSRPLESFFRETISNAYDANVEAGNNDKPIILLVNCISESEYFDARFDISIRDYGIGLGPERFEKIYKYIASSTKRESNDYIGMFGIGRFSCLAVSSSCLINSYYNNVKYIYKMYKNDVGINIDLIGKVNTNQPNGLEVIVKNVTMSNSDFINAIEKLVFFKTLKVVTTNCHNCINESAKRFNERIIEDYGVFSACNVISCDYYRMGNVLYPNNEIPYSIPTKLIVNLPMGSANIVPSREALRFDDSTTALTTAKNKEAIDKYYEVVTEKFDKGFSDIGEWANWAFSYRTFNVTECLTVSKDCIEHFKVAGFYVSKSVNSILKDMCYLDVKEHISYRVTNKYNTYNFGNYVGFPIIIKKDNKYTAKTKAWIDSNYNKYCIIRKESIDDFVERVKDSYIKTKYRKKSEVLRALVLLKNTLNFISIGNSDVPSTFVFASSKKKADTQNTFNVNVYSKDRSESIYYRSSFKNVSELKGLVVYTENKKDNILFTDFVRGVRYNKVHFITVPKTNIHMIPNTRKYISFEQFMYVKHPLIVKFATYRYISKYLTDNDLCCSKIYSNFRNLYDKYYNEIPYNIVNKYINNKWLDYSAIYNILPTPADLLYIKKIEKYNKIKSEILSEVEYLYLGKNPKFGYTKRMKLNHIKSIEFKDEPI